MVIYLLGFICSAFFLEISNKKVDKIVKILCVLISLIVPSLIAGLRASTVGTDLNVYGISSFNLALQSQSLLDFYNNINLDYGFYFVTYVCSRICSDYHFALFVYQFLTIFFIYLFAKECNKKFNISISFFLLIYMFLLFNASLNIMRQCIAVAISSYAFTFVWKKKTIHYLFFLMIAFSFHQTAIISLGLICLYFLFRKHKLQSIKQLSLLCIFLLITLIILFRFENLIQLLQNIGILNSRYGEYVGSGYYTVQASIKVNYSSLLIQPLLLLIPIIYFNNSDNHINGGLTFFLICNLLVALITIFSPLFSAYIYRISYYFIPFQICLLLISIKFINYKDKFFISSSILTLVFVLWFFTIIIRNGHETYPYLFFWQL